MKKLYILCLTILISAASFGQDIAVNGGFENWTAGVPDSWPLIDFDTSELVQNTTIFSEGTSSAQINLNTQTQGDTDIRQTVSMIAGTVYTISLDVYATNNEARARIFGPDYSPSEYSDPAVLNQWQTISFEYTPSTSDNFEFGIRFYDISGDWTGGGSIFYIDNFIISSPVSTSPTLTLQDAPPSGTVDTTSPEETQQQLQFVVTNFNVAVPPAGDGYIMWEVINNGSVIVSGNEQDLSDPVVLPELTQGETYTLNAKLVDNAGADLVPPVEYTLTTTVETYTQVTDLAGLRAGIIGKYYEVTNEVIAVWAQGFDNQKWAQDASAGIIITDFDGIITTLYNEGDGVTGIKGQLDEFNGLLELIPTVDPGTATSTGNPVVAQSVTIADLMNGGHEAFESELVEITDVVFADANGVTTFATNTNYNISDSSVAVAKSNSSSKTNAGPIAFSTYLIRDADYIGQIIPSGPQTIKALVGEYNGNVQIASRNMTTDLILSVDENNIEGFGIYPNPVANGEFKITTAANVDKQVSIFNILGKQVYNKTVKANETVNVANLTTGIYFVNVVEEGKTATKKLVIK